LFSNCFQKKAGKQAAAAPAQTDKKAAAGKGGKKGK
jgi:hypothetical protein